MGLEYQVESEELRVRVGLCSCAVSDLFDKFQWQYHLIYENFVHKTKEIAIEIKCILKFLF